MMDAVVDFHWHDVVIGNEINAIRYAHEREICILRNRASCVHSYESAADSDTPVEETWAGLSYELYESGLDPFTNSIKTIRVLPDEKLIKVTTANHGVYHILYNKLHIFDLQNIVGLEDYFNQTSTGYRVLDWFDAKGIIDRESDITLDGHFVKNIKFFTSCRIDGNKRYKDIVCESFLTLEQLKSPEYTDTMSRFKTLNVLGSFDMPDVQLALWKREIIPLLKTSYKKASDIFWKGA